jgi:hypothetical protein
LVAFYEGNGAIRPKLCSLNSHHKPQFIWREHIKQSDCRRSGPLKLAANLSGNSPGSPSSNGMAYLDINGGYTAG